MGDDEPCRARAELSRAEDAVPRLLWATPCRGDSEPCLAMGDAEPDRERAMHSVRVHVTRFAARILLAVRSAVVIAGAGERVGGDVVNHDCATPGGRRVI